jgi:hypothetical protein
MDANIKQHDEVAVLIKPEDVTERVTQVIAGISALDPTTVECMLTFTVVRKPEGGHIVQAGVVGNDVDISKMLVGVMQICKDGMIAAHENSTPSNPKDIQ